MSEVTWTVTAPSGEVKTNGPKLAHRPAFKINDKTPDSQVAGAKSFNEMRQCLLDHGLMESK